jgi:hypothetical protein
MTGRGEITDERQAPRALLVIESMFGNTAAVGRAVAEGLGLEGVESETVAVSEASERVPGGLDLLVVGAPTHAFSLSRPSTRTDAVRQGAPASTGPHGVREWLAGCRTDGSMPRIAVFDTRVTKVSWLPKGAASTARRIARRRGFAALAPPACFLVEDIKGPLVGGELERAVAWGRSLGTRLVETNAAADSLSQTRRA